MKRRDQERAAQQLAQLARSHHLHLVMTGRRWTRFECHISERQVWVGPPTTPLRYMAALHEMGHIVHTAATHPGAGPLLVEAAAWQWAFDVADPTIVAQLTIEELRRITLAWGSYLPYPGNRAVIHPDLG